MDRATIIMMVAPSIDHVKIADRTLSCRHGVLGDHSRIGRINQNKGTRFLKSEWRTLLVLLLHINILTTENYFINHTASGEPPSGDEQEALTLPKELAKEKCAVRFTPEIGIILLKELVMARPTNLKSWDIVFTGLNTAISTTRPGRFVNLLASRNRKKALLITFRREEMEWLKAWVRTMYW